MKKKTVRRLEYVLHLLTSVLLLLKASSEISQKLYFPGIIIGSIGLIIFTVNTFWKALKIPPKEARLACYFIAAPALLISAYVLYLRRYEFVPYLFFIAGLLYPVVGFISSKKFKRLKKPHRSEA